MFFKKRPIGAPPVTLRQLRFNGFTISRAKSSGRLEGSLGAYTWRLVFRFEEDPFDFEHWLWDYTFIVTLRGGVVYTNTRSFVNVAKAIFGEEYVRQVSEMLAQEFIDEGAAS